MLSIVRLKRTKNKALKNQQNFFGTSPRERAALLWTTVIISAVTLAVVVDTSSSKEIIVKCDDCKAVTSLFTESTSNTSNTSNASPNLNDKSYWQSFGDLFSSSAYLDAEKTSMVLDERMTSLVFPPVYEFKYQRACSDFSCGLATSDIQKIYKKEELPNLKNLTKLPRPLPAGIKEKDILFANINEFSNKKVALFVVSEGGEERGLVYFIEGSKYVPIITSETEQQIITKYGRGGGQMAAFGDSDNFLIVYLGYEGRGFHYNQGQLEDVSRFFGIRVTDLGFYPQIIKQGTGDNSVWYVLSLDAEKNRLIKLWQNKSSHIVGAYDFSDKINQVLSENNGKLAAVATSEKRGEINFIVDEGLDIFENYSLWTFQDNGFDNSSNRLVVSKNVNSKELPISKAQIKDIKVAVDGDHGQYEVQFPCPEFNIFLSNDADNFVPHNPGKMVNFPETNQELYWKIEFLPSADKEYSPWLDNLNALQYLIAQ